MAAVLCNLFSGRVVPLYWGAQREIEMIVDRGVKDALISDRALLDIP